MDSTSTQQPSTSTPSPSSSPSITPQTRTQTTPNGNNSSDNTGKGKSKRLLIGGIVGAVVAIATLIGIWAMLGQSANSTKQAASAPQVKVGFMMSQSGGAATMGLGGIKGVELAKKELGADNIEIVQVDSKCDPKVAPEAIKQLIAQQVVAIIGEGCSSASVAALPEANNAKIPMISPSASSPKLSIPDDYFFRVVPPDNFQGKYLAQSIFDKGVKTVGVFYTNEPYGSSISKIFTDEYQKLGGQVVATTYTEADVIDVNAQMRELSNAKPQAILFVPNTTTTATAGIKLLRQLGYTGPLYGGDALYDKTLITDAGQAAEGLVVTSFNIGTKAFRQSLANEYRSAELAYSSAQTYDALHAIQLAVKGGATTGEAVKNALPNITFQGVTGTIKFDANGEISDPNYKYSLLEVKDGDFAVIE